MTLSVTKIKTTLLHYLKTRAATPLRLTRTLNLLVAFFSLSNSKTDFECKWKRLEKLFTLQGPTHSLFHLIFHPFPNYGFFHDNSRGILSSPSALHTTTTASIIVEDETCVYTAAVCSLTYFVNCEKGK